MRTLKTRWIAGKLISIGIFISLSTPGIAAEIIQAISSEYPPYLSSIPEKDFSGEFAKAAFQAAGIELNITYYPMKRFEMLGKKSVAPVLLGDLTHFTEEQRKTLSAVPIIMIRLVFMYYKPNHTKGIPYESLNDIKSYRVGQVLGSASETILRAANIDAETSKLDGVIKKLRFNRIDIGVVGELSGKMLVKELFPENTNLFGHIEKPLVAFPGHIIFDKNHPEGARAEAIFKHGFQLLKQNKGYLEILHKYYGKGPIPKSVLQFYNTR